MRGRGGTMMSFGEACPRCASLTTLYASARDWPPHRTTPNHLTHTARHTTPTPASPTHPPMHPLVLPPLSQSSGGATRRRCRRQATTLLTQLVHPPVFPPPVAEQWRDNAAALAAAGYHVYAPTMPGYGRSEKPSLTYGQVSPLSGSEGKTLSVPSHAGAQGHFGTLASYVWDSS